MPVPLPRAISSVTVVIPTFDRPDALGRALASVASQRTGGQFAYDIVVVDNASRLDTRATVEDAARSSAVRVRYVREERPGVSHARNRGVLEATGDWIAFCDDDQLAEPDWLRQLVSAARPHEAACVGGSIRLLLPEGTPAAGGVCRRLLGEQPFTGAPFVCTGRDIPSTGNLMVARGVFEALGAFDPAMTAGGEDCELVRRIRASGRIVLVAPDAVVHHVIPRYRTEARYLRWASTRVGAGFAYTDLKQHGRSGLAARCVARVAQAALVTVPRLVLARLRRDSRGAQDARALLWRAAGYVRQTISLLRASVAPRSGFGRSIELRQERALFARAVDPRAPAETRDSR